MHILIGIAVVIGALYLMVVSPVLRWVILLMVAACAAVVLAALDPDLNGTNQRNMAYERGLIPLGQLQLDETNQRNMAYERGLIPLGQLQLDDITVEERYEGVWRVSGTVANNSPSATLTELDLEARVLDCGGPSCVAIGQAFPRVRLDVPPGQRRKLEEDVYLPGVPRSVDERYAITATGTRGQ